ncbi:MAG: HRDC domain-containing protein, partial [Spirochaeta sp.]
GKKRFQQYDWTKRPIDSEALAYAIDDVVHLYKLRDALMKRISETGLLDRYLVENFAVQDTVPDVNRKPGILRGSRVRHLKPRQMKLLEALHAAREEVAEQVNLPPNSVLPNRELFSIVAGQRTPRDVRSPRNMPQPAFDELIERFNRIITEV